MTATMPVGILDSGMGGFSVVKEFTSLAPHENIVYIGDELHLPYGEKTASEIIKYTRRMVKYFESIHAKFVIFACNTATAVALETIRQEFSIPMIGVINSAVEELENDTFSKVGVIATRATTKSKIYPQKIASRFPNAKVIDLATPKLVELVENQADSDEIYRVTKESIEPLLTSKPDSLILGCTHYPFLGNVFTELLPNARIINPAQATARKAVQQLTAENQLNEQKDSGKIMVFSTKDKSNLEAFARKQLNKKDISFSVINLGEDD